MDDRLFSINKTRLNEGGQFRYQFMYSCLRSLRFCAGFLRRVFMRSEDYNGTAPLCRPFEVRRRFINCTKGVVGSLNMEISVDGSGLSTFLRVG